MPHAASRQNDNTWANQERKTETARAIAMMREMSVTSYRNIAEVGMSAVRALNWQNVRKRYPFASKTQACVNDTHSRTATEKHQKKAKRQSR